MAVVPFRARHAIQVIREGSKTCLEALCARESDGHEPTDFVIAERPLALIAASPVAVVDHVWRALRGGHGHDEDSTAWLARLLEDPAGDRQRGVDGAGRHLADPVDEPGKFGSDHSSGAAAGVFDPDDEHA